MSVEDFDSGVLIAVAFALGIFSGAIILFLLGQPIIIETQEVVVQTQDVNLSGIHNRFDRLELIRLNSALCGVNQPILGVDGNVLVRENVVPPGLVYTCFVLIQQG